MNDGGMDAGPDQGLLPDGSLPGGTKIEAVELTGLSLYYDHWWNDQWSSSIGYSFTEVDNTAGQTGDTYEKGQYASANLLYYPVENVHGRRRVALGRAARTRTAGTTTTPACRSPSSTTSARHSD